MAVKLKEVYAKAPKGCMYAQKQILIKQANKFFDSLYFPLRVLTNLIKFKDIFYKIDGCNINKMS